MAYINTCRVCLVDGAEYPLFEDFANEESIHSKFVSCFKEKIKDIDEHPRKICEACKQILEIVHDFIKKYKTSSKLLEIGHLVAKVEQQETKMEDAEFEDDIIMICKNEPNSDYDEIEALDDYWLTIYEPNKVEEEINNTNVTKLRAKLKCLKEISFKKKPQKRKKCSRKNVATPVIEAKLNTNGERQVVVRHKSIKSKPKEQEIKLINQEPAMATISTPLKRILQCDVCGKTFNSSESLQHHQNVEHFGKPVKCPHCPKLFNMSRNFKRHIDYVHGEKTFICDHCGYAFARKHLLLNHIKKVHLGFRGKRYPCNKCGKTFIAPKYVIIHDRSVHTGLRPFQCNECGSRFLHEDYLKEHMRLHTGETPFKCPICSRGYAQRGNMISHISHNHRLSDLSEEQIKTFRPSWFKYLKKD